MNTIGVLITVAVFVTVHFSIMKMFKRAVRQQIKKSNTARPFWTK